MIPSRCKNQDGFVSVFLKLREHGEKSTLFLKTYFLFNIALRLVAVAKVSLSK
jgi:hypothetical protein